MLRFPYQYLTRPQFYPRLHAITAMHDPMQSWQAPYADTELQ